MIRRSFAFLVAFDQNTLTSLPKEASDVFDLRRNPLVSFAVGFALPLQALRLLFQRHHLKRWAVLPLIANVVLYVLVCGLFVWLIGNWNPGVSDWEFWGPVGGWISAAINFTSGPLKWLIAIPLFIATSWFTFTSVGMVIASPFNDMLSERVERAICYPRETLDVPLRLTVVNAIVGVFDSLKIIGLQIVAMLLVLPLLAIPLLGFLPLFLVIAYFSGLGFFDVSMARNDLRYRHKKAMFREIHWELLGMGVAIELLFLVPFLGFFVLPMGVTAGTMLYCRRDWVEHFDRHGIDAPRTWHAPEIVSLARIDSN